MLFSQVCWIHLSLLLLLTWTSAFVLFIKQHIYISDSKNTSEKWSCAVWLFHGTMPNSKGPECHMVPYESAHCDDNFTGLPDPAFCCGIAMWVLSALICEEDWQKYKVWGKSGCLRQDASAPAIHPRLSKVKPEMVGWHTQALMAKCRML